MFSVYVGKLPKSGTTVMLPVAQSYSDGSVRNWDDPVIEGQAEPEHPAPAFTTTSAASAEHSHADTAAATQVTEPVASVSPYAGTPGQVWVAMVAGVLGLAAGIAAFLRSGRTRRT